MMSVYNGQPYLDDAIRSIRSQTLVNFGFIVINDGSTDNPPRAWSQTRATTRPARGPRCGRHR